MEQIKSFIILFRSEFILVFLSLLLIGGSGLLFFTEKSEPKRSFDEIISPEPSSIHIEINGAVKKPDVYSFPEYTRLKDVLQKAELADNADRLYISRSFNLARFVKDQEKIYVPSKDEVSQGIFPPDVQIQAEMSSRAESSNSQVNINLATIAELDTLPGIGKTTAQKIIDGRPYSSLNELTDKKILSVSQFNQLKTYFSLGE